jgi:BlaI family transcriptional regulator, penicillinase repressor
LPRPKLSPLELQIMDAFWRGGPSSVREVQERFPEDDRPAYTTIQTMVYRLEAKKVIRRVKKIGNAHVFEAVISREDAQRRFVDDLLAFFGGRTQLVMAHLVETGRLTMRDVKDAEQLLKSLAAKDKAGKDRDR